MCGSRPTLPLEQRPDDQLQLIVNNAEKHPGTINVWRKGQRTIMNHNPYARLAGEAQKILDQRDQKREELDRIASERTAVIEAQQKQVADAQRQMREQVAAQKATVREAQARKDKAFTQAAKDQAATLAQMNDQQDLRMRSIQTSGQALRSSMQILSEQGGQQGPTAQTDRRRRRGGSARSTSAALRIGSTSNSPGAGANLSV